MELRERPSGLVEVFDKPPGPPKPQCRYARSEIQRAEHREQAREALLLLWDAMSLSSGGGGIRLPDHENFDHYYALYRYVGELLLGRDCPEKEMRT